MARDLAGLPKPRVCWIVAGRITDTRRHHPTQLGIVIHTHRCQCVFRQHGEVSFKIIVVQLNIPQSCTCIPACSNQAYVPSCSPEIHDIQFKCLNSSSICCLSRSRTTSSYKHNTCTSVRQHYQSILVLTYYDAESHSLHVRFDNRLSFMKALC